MTTRWIVSGMPASGGQDAGAPESGFLTVCCQNNNSREVKGTGHATLYLQRTERIEGNPRVLGGLTRAFGKRDFTVRATASVGESSAERWRRTSRTHRQRCGATSALRIR